MLENLFKHVSENQQIDGEVDRDEFDPRNDREGWPEGVHPENRQSMERYVYNRVPERHRFRTADGEKGIVFFDSRGRATSGLVTEMDDEELLRLARSQGKRVKGDKRFRPSKDPGYQVPDLAEEVQKLVEGMRGATEKEFNDAVAKAKWPKPRRMFSGKPDTGSGTMDAIFNDRGTEVASKHVIYKRGKQSQVSYMVNADYLGEK
jgi:hypothetical protein